jgi:hypothetical protein
VPVAPKVRPSRVCPKHLKVSNKLRERLRKAGSESVTNCHRLKLPAADGKRYLTDVATAETLLRLVQSIPSPKAEPIKLWLARVGYKQMRKCPILPKRWIVRFQYVTRGLPYHAGGYATSAWKQRLGGCR